MDLGVDNKWDWKFEYEDLIKIKRYNLLTYIKSQSPVTRYDSENCPIKVDIEYKRILEYEKFRKYEPIARIAYGIRKEKEYKENKMKNDANLKKAKGKGKGQCTVTYVYLPENAYDEETEVMRKFCNEYTTEELKRFGKFLGTNI